MAARDSKGHFIKVKTESKVSRSKASETCKACRGLGLKNGVIDATELCSKCDGAGTI